MVSYAEKIQTWTLDMRATRLKYKYALQQCRYDEEQNRASALILSLYCKYATNFLKGVRGIKESRVPLATKVDDASIAQLWQDQFSFFAQQCAK